jgi:hypothetical protein
LLVRLSGIGRPNRIHSPVLAAITLAAAAWAQSDTPQAPAINSIANRGEISRTEPAFRHLSDPTLEGRAAGATVSVRAPEAFKAHSNAKKWWILSGLALTAASMADLETSIGHNEANPALQGSTGKFSMGRGISLKLGLAGATILFQSLIARHRPALYETSAIVNTIGSGVLTAAAIHNTNTPR